MEFKHSPAPWMATKREFFIELYDDNGSYVGLTNSTANAHLIAAAPELLEALQKLVTEYKFTRSQLNCDTDEELEDVLCVINANKAIAKALGQQ